eukprot:FR737268.1.p2 GENE.FR737268.1~~FR737268.1.p2  ORF type:complete len:127 (+),score=36.83 FR737268.1:604-984(+)
MATAQDAGSCEQKSRRYDDSWFRPSLVMPRCSHLVHVKTEFGWWATCVLLLCASTAQPLISSHLPLKKNKKKKKKKNINKFKIYKSGPRGGNSRGQGNLGFRVFGSGGAPGGGAGVLFWALMVGCF